MACLDAIGDQVQTLILVEDHRAGRLDADRLHAFLDYRLEVERDVLRGFRPEDYELDFVEDLARLVDRLKREAA